MGDHVSTADSGGSSIPKQLLVVQLTKRQLVTYLAVASILGGIAGALICGLLAGGRASDEPPIRVRGGSLEAEIVSLDPVEWQEGQGADAKTWFLVSGGKNDKEEYVVKLLMSGGTCDRPVPGLAKNVLIEFPAQTFDVQHTGKKSRIKTKGGILRPFKNLIRFPGSQGHFVEKITFQPPSGPKTECVFRENNQFVELCLCASSSACTGICR